MGKKLFGGVRTQLVGTLIAAVGGLALTACNCCNPSPVYKRPCCAQSGAPMYAPQYAPQYGAPTTAPMMATTAGRT